jgi:hypothetical protein
VRLWFAFPLWPRMMSILSFIFYLIGLLPLKRLYSVHLHISSLGHWILGNLVFWVPSILWFSIHFLMYSWQRFPLILWVPSSTWKPYFFSAETFKFHVLPFVNPFSYLLSWSSTENIIVYAYCFQCIPCSFLY